MGSYTFDRIKILVTSHCNLNCKHCYQHFDKNKYMLSREKVYEIIDFAVENNTRIVDFSGGEFFAYPYAYEILEYCYKQKLKVNIATNATIINTERVINYKDYLTFQVSIDGLKENHELRRGIGSWDKMIKTVKKLYDEGFNLSANMVLDDKNYLDAIEVLKIHYFSNISFSPVAYVGAAKKETSDSDMEDYENTICYLMNEIECGGEPFNKQIFPNVLCLKYNGNVYISPVASDYDIFCMGNIENESLAKICEQYYQSNEFKELCTIDSRKIQECNECIESNRCDRGDRLRAYKFFGELNAPDPFLCRVYINEYDNKTIGDLFWGIKM